MKINPLDIITKANKNFEYDFYLISGNEITLMEKIKEIIINNFKNTGKYIVERKTNLKDIDQDSSLFFENKIYLFDSVNNIDKNSILNIDNQNSIYVFVSENSPKNKSLKNLFTKEKNCCLLDCYELSKTDKSRLLKFFLNEVSKKISEDVFWFIVDKADNRFIFFNQLLDKIQIIEDITLNVVKKIILQDTQNIDKIFFDIFDKNENIIINYNKKIEDVTSLNKFFFSIKNYCDLIIKTKNLSEFENQIPRYLFREKDVFIKIFKKIDNNKKNNILDLLYKTEKSIRKLESFKQIIGLRFLLNLKRIIVS